MSSDSIVHWMLSRQFSRRILSRVPGYCIVYYETVLPTIPARLNRLKIHLGPIADRRTAFLYWCPAWNYEQELTLNAL